MIGRRWLIREMLDFAALHNIRLKSQQHGSLKSNQALESVRREKHAIELYSQI